jgi:uncharacterized protein YidB (DUF937 family)
MSEGFPSMTALLGLLAVAGYQNRDKIAEMLGGGARPGVAAAPGGAYAQPNAPAQPGGPAQGGLGGLGSLLGNLGGGGVGGFLGSGLNELVNRMQQNGQGNIAQSWVNHGPNQQIAPSQLEQSIGSDVLQHLTQQTGLSREDLLARLSSTLPHAVDQYTPDGQLPPR